MGMDVDAMLMVGARGCDIDVESVTDNQTLYEFAEENDMDVASPYYDCCDHEEQFIGFEIRNFSDEEDLINKIKAAKDKFLDLAHTMGEFEAVANVY